VVNPKACPQCKRHFRDSKPIPADEEILQEWIELPKEVKVEDSGVQYQCSFCREIGEDEEGPYIWDKAHYCLRHLVDLIIAYDRTHVYKKPDIDGKLEIAREDLRDAIRQAIREA